MHVNFIKLLSDFNLIHPHYTLELQRSCVLQNKVLCDLATVMMYLLKVILRICV